MIKRFLTASVATAMGISFGGAVRSATDAGYELSMRNLAMKKGCPELARFFAPSGKEEDIEDRLNNEPLAAAEIPEAVASLQEEWRAIRLAATNGPRSKPKNGAGQISRSSGAPQLFSASRVGIVSTKVRASKPAARRAVRRAANAELRALLV